MITEFLNRNSLRSYPLRENSSNELPLDAILDLHLSVPASLADVYLSAAVLTPELVLFEFASAAGPVASISLRPYQVSPGKALQLGAAADGVSGVIVLGAGAVSAAGRYTLNAATGALESTVVKVYREPPYPSVADFGTPQISLAGDVIFRADGDAVLAVDGQVLKFSITEVDNARLTYLGPCDQGAQRGGCGAPPIAKINGVVHPDPAGTVFIEVG